MEVAKGEMRLERPLVSGVVTLGRQRGAGVRCQKQE